MDWPAIVKCNAENTRHFSPLKANLQLFDNGFICCCQ